MTRTPHAQSAPAVPAPRHRPRFSFRTLGGSCLGQRWIYDHEEPIACLEHRTLDQPEQELLYFGDVPRPINLRYLKLRPGGRPLISGVQLYWKLKAGKVITSQLVRCDVESQDGEELCLIVVTRDAHGVATSTRTLTLSYDPERGSYVYRFDCDLDIHHPHTLGGAERFEFEYCDPWYVDLPAPSQAFEGMWPERPYTHFVGEMADGSVWKMPLNHQASLVMQPLGGLRPDGLFLPAFEPGHNVAFEYVGDTGPRTRVGVCHWGYDIHCLGHYTRAELERPLRETFRILLCDDDRAQVLLASGGEVPELSYRGHTELPAYEREGSFARGVVLNQPSPGPTDPFLWEPEVANESEASWCHDEGHSDDHCLKISKAGDGPACWVMLYEGQGSFCGYWPTAGSWRLRCWIRTEDVRGESYLGVSWNFFHKPIVWPLHTSERLRGTNDWTVVEVVLDGPPPAGVSDLNVRLQQDGSGTTWFDDLVVEHLPEPA